MAMKNRQILARLSLTEFFYNGCFASANFLPVFLQSLGLSAGGIGLITALTNAMNIVAQPVWGVISDKTRSVRRCFMLSIALSALCVVFVPRLSLGGGLRRGAMLCMLVVFYFFLTPANMLMEMWLVRVNDHPELDISYGAIRIWASIGFALVSLAYVPVLNRLPVRSVYSFYVLFAALCVAAAARVPPWSEGEPAQRPRQRLRDMPFRRMLTYWVVTYMIFEVLFQIPFGWRNAYMVYALNSFGVDSRSYGAFMFAAGVLEVPMLLGSGRLIRRFGLAWPILASALLLMGEYMLYACGRSVASLMAAQALRGFGFALYVACRHQYIRRLAPPDLENSTLALINAAYAGINILSVALGGFLLEKVGTRSFYTVLAAVQLAAVLFFAAAQWVGVGALGLSLPDLACALRRPRTE